ncbi:RdgB/HAM1 family non-canonical purine NTP pyrophosphatase [Rhodanobacter sp. C05]|uniref:RdgB/HAM1 family non-canonical purine NTP pyrophosphatase n=1 Tax=Rhodanobacter sp. C05 TaxID=1945855 RepID=UPI0009848952|nr:RdgB/HAM1 family non-canonical purine NTP pyrophosphatase [Rhodanobacter sp. C05]OOG42416.1 non-canonical purine NTP pyrophosphatase, RdgB/HAM1 family [Rhodanobacter sp. C05]
MSRIVLASSNPGKLKEFGALLADSGLEVIAQGSLGIEDAEETGLTFVENALLKARHAAQASGLPALADDSGLCVDHLHGAPGLYSARYSGGHGDAAANNAKLLRELDGVPAEQRGAFFICVLVLLQHADDPSPLIAEARWHGHILPEGRGSGGFGYNPVFLPTGYSQSVAEMDDTLKKKLSHRGQALVLLHERLRELRHA